MLDESDFDRPVINKPLIGVAIAVVIAALGGWYYWHGHQAPPAPAPVVAVPAPPAAPAEEAIQHPVPAAGADANAAPLPALADSDTAFNGALRAVADAATPYLIPDSIIRHIVVTVDNLPRQKVAVEKRPLKAVAGTFVADGDELHATLDAQNFLRYRPLINALQQTDMQRLASVYLRFYPLFQKAYQDLGYPNGYFNDRLVQVIDVLLATPQVAGPVELVQPNVMYLFADPALESLSAGQKLLIRMGPENAAAVKAKLTELRAILTAAPPQH